MTTRISVKCMTCGELMVVPENQTQEAAIAAHEKVCGINSVDTLLRVQTEVGQWATQFGDNESHDPRYMACGVGVTLKALPPLLGMIEEMGELVAPILKRHQGRGFMNPSEYHNAVQDALADCLIFMCDYANREKIVLAPLLHKTWEKVKQRRQKTWQADKDKEVERGESLPPNPDGVDPPVPGGYVGGQLHEEDERPIRRGGSDEYRPEDERLPLRQTSRGHDPAEVIKWGLEHGWELRQVGTSYVIAPINDERFVSAAHTWKHADPVDHKLAPAYGTIMYPKELVEASRRSPLGPSFSVSPTRSGAGIVAGPLEQNGQGFAEPPAEVKEPQDGFEVARTIAQWLDIAATGEAIRLIERKERDYREFHKMPPKSTHQRPTKPMSVPQFTQAAVPDQASVEE